MTKEELKAHCEKQVEECEKWAKYKGIEPSGKIYEEHKLILDLINSLVEQQPCEDAISLQAVINMTGLSNWFESSDDYNNFVEELCTLPPVTPTHGTCKDCRHREGIDLDASFCAKHGNSARNDFYCADFEKRGNENG